MRKLLFALFLLAGINASAQKDMSILLSDFIYNEDMEDVVDRLGSGQVYKSKLTYRIMDKVDDDDAIGALVFKFQDSKTWYNTEYKGVAAIMAEIAIEDHVKDDKWNWHWWRYLVNGLKDKGFELLDYSTGSLSTHFVVLKKKNIQIGITQTSIWNKKGDRYDNTMQFVITFDEELIKE